MSIRVIDFPEHEIFNTNIYADDRYFLPFTTVFTLEDGRTLQYATTQEEFYEINKEVIEILKEKNQWILTQ
jgi:hypothetical protein